MALVIPCINHTRRAVENNTDTHFCALNWFTSSAAGVWTSTDEFKMEYIITESNTTIGAWKWVVDTAPGASASWTFTLRKNGADTALESVISGTSTSVAENSTTVSFDAGDKVSIKITPNGSPNNGAFDREMRILVHATDMMLMSCTGDAANASLDTTRVFGVQGLVADSPPSIVTNDPEDGGDDFGGFIFPIGGTLKNFRIFTNVPATDPGDVRVFRFYINDGTEFLTLTLSTNETDITDLSTTQAITAGDAMVIRHSRSIGVLATFAQISMSFDMDDDTKGAPYMTGDANAPTSTVYTNSLSGANFDAGTPETSFDYEIGTYIVRDLYAFHDAAIAAGQSYTYTFRKNATDTDLNLLMSAGETTASNTVNTVSIDEDSGDSLSLEFAPSSSDVGKRTTFTSLACMVKWNGLTFPPGRLGFIVHPPSGGNTLELC